MLRPFPLRVFHHHGAFLALYVPPVVSPYPVLPHRVRCGQVHSCSSCLDLVDRSVDGPGVLVFEGVWPVSDQFPKFVYRFLIVEPDLGGRHYPTICHQVGVCNDVMTAWAVPSFPVGGLVWPSACCP